MKLAPYIAALALTSCFDINGELEHSGKVETGNINEDVTQALDGQTAEDGHRTPCDDAGGDRGVQGEVETEEGDYNRSAPESDDSEI